MCHSLDSCVEDNWSAPLASVMSPDKKNEREREREREKVRNYKEGTNLSRTLQLV